MRVRSVVVAAVVAALVSLAAWFSVDAWQRARTRDQRIAEADGRRILQESDDAERAAEARASANAAASASIAIETQHANAVAKIKAMTPDEQAALRVRFAAALEVDMLNEHKAPDGVSVTGDGNRTLVIRGYFCSKQWVWDFAKSDLGQSAVDAGIREVQCKNASGTYPIAFVDK